MLVKDQKVIIEWSSGNKRFYIDKKYIFTKYGDKFEVELDDLSIHNTIYIKFKCDYCGEPFSKRWCDYIKTKNKGKLTKDACKECKGKAISESKMQYTYEDMVEIFLEKGFKPLISKENYKTSYTQVNYECLECGHKSKMSLSHCILDRRCKKCVMKELIDQQRHSYDYVKSVFEENDCELLSKEYINNHELLDYVCECGNPSRISFKSFVNGHRCNICAIEKVAEAKRLPIEYVKEIFINEGCELLEDNYINNRTEMKYKCSCGNIDYKALDHFIRGQRCDECAIKKLKESLRHEYEYVKSVFEEKGFELLSEEYINAQEPLLYLCTCNRPAITTFNNLLKISGCRVCAGEKRRGENASNWNYDLTDEEREIKRSYPEYVQWRKDVFERDNYTCQCCHIKGGSLCSHHLDGYHWCKERRLDVNNGITLCRDCHWDFHLIYGTKNNTEQQFREFIFQKLRNQLLFYLTKKGVI